MLVSVIVPAYKQEKTIKKDVERICDVMSDIRFDYEVIVVVDGFLDKTMEIAQKINRPHLTVIGYEKNQGKGFAVKYGMKKSKGDFVAFIDAGMEIDPNGISMILEHMLWYEADIIVGSKRHPASKVHYPPLRRLYSWGYHTLIRLLFRLSIKDTQTGLKVYRRAVLNYVLPKLVVKKYAFDIELIAVAKYLGFDRIYEAPVKVSFDFNSGSRFTKFLFMDPLIRNMFIDTIAVFYRMYILKYYLPDNLKKSK